jgi:hypothetical protein
MFICLQKKKPPPEDSWENRFVKEKRVYSNTLTITLRQSGSVTFMSRRLFTIVEITVVLQFLHIL